MKAAHPEVVAATRVNPGETLRLARESRGWTQAQVATRLNLTVSSLNNLETGAFDKLPGHTFARGYIRAYAKLLEMDQAVLVQAFDSITGTNGQGSNVHGLGKIEEPSRLAHNILRIVSLLLLVLVIGGGFFWWQDQAAQRAKDAPPVAMEHVEVESADGTTQIHPLDEPEEPAPATAPAVTPGQPASLAMDSKPAVDPSSPAAPAQPEAAATHPAVPISAPAPVVTAPVASTATVPASAAPAPAAGEGQVSMQFVADCWTQVSEAGGKVLFSGLKRKGDSLQVNGKPPFAVRLGFARGAQVSYNGQSVDLTKFTSGETARLKLGQ